MKSFPARKSNRQRMRRGGSCTCCKGKAEKLNCDMFGKGGMVLQIIRTRHPCFHAAFSIVCRPICEYPERTTVRQHSRREWAICRFPARRPVVNRSGPCVRIVYCCTTITTLKFLFCSNLDSRFNKTIDFHRPNVPNC